MRHLKHLDTFTLYIHEALYNYDSQQTQVHSKHTQRTHATWQPLLGKFLRRATETPPRKLTCDHCISLKDPSQHRYITLSMTTTATRPPPCLSVPNNPRSLCMDRERAGSRRDRMTSTAVVLTQRYVAFGNSCSSLLIVCLRRY